MRNDPLLAVLVDKADPYDGASESECRLSVFLHGGSFTSQPGGYAPTLDLGMFEAAPSQLRGLRKEGAGPRRLRAQEASAMPLRK